MFEIIIVVAIVVTVAGLVVRSLYRTITGKNDGCAGTCPGCAQGEECGWLNSCTQRSKKNNPCPVPTGAWTVPVNKKSSSGHCR